MYKSPAIRKLLLIRNIKGLYDSSHTVFMQSIILIAIL